MQATIEGFYRDAGIDQLVKEKRAQRATDGQFGNHGIVIISAACLPLSVILTKRICPSATLSRG